MDKAKLIEKIIDQIELTNQHGWMKLAKQNISNLIDEYLTSLTAPVPDGKAKLLTFEKELESLINRYSKENGSDTPDFILADYLNRCLLTFDSITKLRTQWHKGVVPIAHINTELLTPKTPDAG